MCANGLREQRPAARRGPRHAVCPAEELPNAKEKLRDDEGHLKSWPRMKVEEPW